MGNAPDRLRAGAGNVHVLITGGLGFIGHHLSLALLASGAQVTIVDLPRFGAASLPARSGREFADRTRIVLADVRDREAWFPLLSAVDVVVHCAGVHQIDEVEGDVLRHIDVNVGGTRTVLDGLVQYAVPRLVYLSSAKVYGQNSGHPSREDDIRAPVDSYALGKTVAEQYGADFAARHGLEVCSVRPFSVIGPGQPTNTGYIGALLDGACQGGRVVLPGTPEMSRDFVSIDTVVDTCVAAVVAEAAPPPVVNCGSGTSTTLAALTETFEEVAQREMVVAYREPRPGTLERTHADTELMQRFACPRVPALEETLARTLGTHLGLP